MIKRILLCFLFLFSFLITTSIAQPTSIDVSDEFDFQLAVNFAMDNRVDTLFLTTPDGLYTTTDTSFFHITRPIVIMKKPGVAGMPTITHSDDSTNVLEIFRVSDDLTVEGIIFDGGHALSHGMKYALRAGEWPNEGPPAKTGLNIIAKNCVFKNIYRDKDPEGQGHGIYFLKGVEAGTVRVEDCKFEDIGDEAIRMSETEKFDTERVVDSLIVRNTTFTNIDAECIRFYADTDTSTADGFLLFENLTMNNTATRVMYIKNNQYTAVRNIIITNSRLPGNDRMDRADYLIEVQQKGSYIANVDTFNVLYGPVPREDKLNVGKGGIGVIPGTVFDFDPMYVDAASGNYTLQDNSPAYYSGANFSNLGDENWATGTSNRKALAVTLDGEGVVEFSPAPLGLTFASGTEVALTAVPEEGNQFISWSGGITGSENPTTITLDANTAVTAKFDVASAVGDDQSKPFEYSLQQNYPNPFNPSTAITFSLASSEFTTLKIYDVLGREVITLFSKELNAGSHTYFFNASNLASGIYYYRLDSGEFSSVKKMMLIK